MRSQESFHPSLCPYLFYERSLACSQDLFCPTKTTASRFLQIQTCSAIVHCLWIARYGNDVICSLTNLQHVDSQSFSLPALVSTGYGYQAENRFCIKNQRKSRFLIINIMVHILLTGMFSCQQKIRVTVTAS